MYPTLIIVCGVEDVERVLQLILGFFETRPKSGLGSSGAVIHVHDVTLD